MFHHESAHSANLTDRERYRKARRKLSHFVKSAYDLLNGKSQRTFHWCCVFFVFIFYFYVLVRSHLYPDMRVIDQLSRQYQLNERIARDRIAIYDCDNFPIALSVSSWSVFMDPGMPGFDAASIDLLAQYVDTGTLVRLRGALNRRFYWVKRYISRNEAEEIVKIAGNGYYIREERKRSYPHGKVFSHILGFCDHEGWGVAGLERTWNDSLILPPQTKIHYRGRSSIATS